MSIFRNKEIWKSLLQERWHRVDRLFLVLKHVNFRCFIPRTLKKMSIVHALEKMPKSQAVGLSVIAAFGLSGVISLILASKGKFR